ncbi:formate dehydrogenase subunit delta [Marivivens aquimaris]|uniref:formate dehydrogenase subunit delta n=1 Tax=Marivivens aquimaris TaxID=2774876 RepID=UPI0018828FE6|nr:formate dehydrogenase subunit delta [Marivivens aquimaris]
MKTEKMVYMANQIATFFSSQPTDQKAEGVAAHINDFWEPRMREQLLAHCEAGGEGLSDLALDACKLVKQPA